MPEHNPAAIAARPPLRFANQMMRLAFRDLNTARADPSVRKPTRDDIVRYLADPGKNEKELRNAALFLYQISPHFRSLISYFTGLTDWAYVVIPQNIDTSTAKAERWATQYRKTLKLLAEMNIPTQFSKVLSACLREDTFFGTLRASGDRVSLQQLPFDRCRLATITNNVLNVEFDFSYFDTDKKLLDFYAPEFTTKYQIFLKNKSKMRWQTLDAPDSFAIKCNSDILPYSIPPFIGLFREVYDIEDYKQLKMARTEVENYAMLVMRVAIDNGAWSMEEPKAHAFWENMNAVLPPEIGSILSPLPIDKITFDRNAVGDADTVAAAEQNLFTAAGVSSLLFNNEKASSNALLLSIKVDQAITYRIVQGIECAVNRYVQGHSFGKNFKATFLDVSPFNRREAGDQYLKACQFGIPMVSYYCASQGLPQADMDALNFLEQSLLRVNARFDPLRSSNTQSSDVNDEGGRPPKDVGDLGDAGEQSRETTDGDNA